MANLQVSRTSFIAGRSYDKGIKIAQGLKDSISLHIKPCFVWQGHHHHNSALINYSICACDPVECFVYADGARIDALISAAERAVVLLQERRSAVIAAAVTGQSG
jgi:hypothetical protein